MRPTRAYLAGFGTAGSLLAAAAIVFVLAGALVAVHGWPQIGAGATPSAVVVPAAPTAQHVRPARQVLAAFRLTASVHVAHRTARTARTGDRRSAATVGQRAAVGTTHTTSGRGAAATTGGSTQPSAGTTTTGGSPGSPATPSVPVPNSPATGVGATVTKTLTSVSETVSKLGETVGKTLGGVGSTLLAR